MMNMLQIVRIAIPYCLNHPRKSFDQKEYMALREVGRRQHARLWRRCLLEELSQ